MIIYTDGLDVSIKELMENRIEFTLSNENEKTQLDFQTDQQGMEHTAEQFISALANHNEELLIKLLSDFANLEVK